VWWLEALVAEINPARQTLPYSRQGASGQSPDPIAGTALYLTNNEHKCTDLALPAVAFAVWLAKAEPWRAASRDAKPWQVALSGPNTLLSYLLPGPWPGLRESAIKAEKERVPAILQRR
jgi:hypothetical protein